MFSIFFFVRFVPTNANKLNHWEQFSTECSEATVGNFSFKRGVKFPLEAESTEKDAFVC